MVITWYGLSCFKISSGELTVVTDPFGKNTGLTPPRVQTHVAVISNSDNEAYNNLESLGGDDTFVIDSSGEFDVRGLFVHGIPAKGDTQDPKTGFDYTTIYSIRMEDMKLAFLGSLKQKELTDMQLESLGEIDILFVPVGNKVVCSPEDAVVIVNQIEPRIVIPMHYAQKGLKLALDDVKHFLKEYGVPDSQEQDRFTIKKSGLPETDAAQIILLSAQR